MSEPAKVFEGRVKQHRMHPHGIEAATINAIDGRAGVLIALGAALLFLLG
jgi:hypothetical protein